MAKHPHTPGPWNLDEDDLTIFADVGAAVCEVNDVEDFPCVEEGTEDDVAAECRANALLIAAAPDLLEALKWLADFNDAANENRVTQDQADLYSSMTQFARAAIAKAEGK